MTPPDPEDLADYMPPNAPPYVSRTGVLEPPNMLEDLELELTPKGGGGLFGSDEPPEVTEETLRTLRRE